MADDVDLKYEIEEISRARHLGIRRWPKRLPDTAQMMNDPLERGIATGEGNNTREREASADHKRIIAIVSLSGRLKYTIPFYNAFSQRIVTISTPKLSLITQTSIPTYIPTYIPTWL